VNNDQAFNASNAMQQMIEIALVFTGFHSCATGASVP
jgi:hypothetical protein